MNLNLIKYYGNILDPELDWIVEACEDDIEAAITALEACTRKTMGPTEVALFTSIGILEDIQAKQKIIDHPYPQNREGNRGGEVEFTVAYRELKRAPGKELAHISDAELLEEAALPGDANRLTTRYFQLTNGARIRLADVLNHQYYPIQVKEIISESEHQVKYEVQEDCPAFRAKEPAGLLGLSRLNIPVTKDELVAYIKQNVAARIEKLKSKPEYSGLDKVNDYYETLLKVINIKVYIAEFDKPTGLAAQRLLNATRIGKIKAEDLPHIKAALKRIVKLFYPTQPELLPKKEESDVDYAKRVAEYLYQEVEGLYSSDAKKRVSNEQAIADRFAKYEARMLEKDVLKSIRDERNFDKVNELLAQAKKNRFINLAAKDEFGKTIAFYAVKHKNYQLLYELAVVHNVILDPNKEIWVEKGTINRVLHTVDNREDLWRDAIVDIILDELKRYLVDLKIDPKPMLTRWETYANGVFAKEVEQAKFKYNQLAAYDAMRFNIESIASLQGAQPFAVIQQQFANYPNEFQAARKEIIEKYLNPQFEVFLYNSNPNHVALRVPTHHCPLYAMLIRYRLAYELVDALPHYESLYKAAYKSLEDQFARFEQNLGLLVIPLGGDRLKEIRHEYAKLGMEESFLSRVEVKKADLETELLAILLETTLDAAALAPKLALLRLKYERLSFDLDIPKTTGNAGTDRDTFMFATGGNIESPQLATIYARIYANNFDAIVQNTFYSIDNELSNLLRMGDKNGAAKRGQVYVLFGFEERLREIVLATAPTLLNTILAPAQPQPAVPAAPPLHIEWLRLLRKDNLVEAKDYLAEHHDKPNFDINQVDAENRGALYYALSRGDILFAHDLVVMYNINTEITVGDFHTDNPHIIKALAETRNEAARNLLWDNVIIEKIFSLLENHFTARTLTTEIFEQLKWNYNLPGSDIFNDAVYKFDEEVLDPLFKDFLYGRINEGDLTIDTFRNIYTVIKRPNQFKFSHQDAIKHLANELRNYVEKGGIGNLNAIKEKFKRLGADAQHINDQVEIVKGRIIGQLEYILLFDLLENIPEVSQRLKIIQESFGRLDAEDVYGICLNKHFETFDAQLKEHLAAGRKEDAQALRPKYELFNRLSKYEQISNGTLTTAWLNLLKIGDFSKAAAWLIQHQNVEGFDIKTKDSEGHNALYYALSYRNYELARDLVNQGIHELPREFGSPLVVAAVVENTSKAWEQLIAYDIYQELAAYFPFTLTAAVYTETKAKYAKFRNGATIAGDMLLDKNVKPALKEAVNGARGLSISLLRAICRAIDKGTEFDIYFNNYRSKELLPPLENELRTFLHNGVSRDLATIKEKFVRIEAESQFNRLTHDMKVDLMAQLEAFIDKRDLVFAAPHQEELKVLKDKFERLGLSKEYTEIVSRKFNAFDIALKEHLAANRDDEVILLQPKYQLFELEESFKPVREKADLMRRINASSETELKVRFGAFLNAAEPNPAEKDVLNSIREWYKSNKKEAEFNKYVNNRFVTDDHGLRDCLRKNDLVKLPVIKSRYSFFDLQDRFQAVCMEIDKEHSAKKFSSFIANSITKLCDPQIFAPEPNRSAGTLIAFRSFTAANYEAKEKLVVELRQIKNLLERSPREFDNCCAQAVAAISSFHTTVVANKGGDARSHYEDGFNRILTADQLAKIKAGDLSPISSNYTPS